MTPCPKHPGGTNLFSDFVEMRNGTGVGQAMDEEEFLRFFGYEGCTPATTRATMAKK